MTAANASRSLTVLIAAGAKASKAPTSITPNWPDAVTVTRAAELSNVSYMHSRLVDLERVSDLHVWEGLGHAFHLDAKLPEGQQAYRVMARFFAKHLGTALPASHPAPATTAATR